ncbi:MAG: hypothetical protein HC875_36055, partial [Anaerolineales bacterium]|nr:hypothetical protein [Anaerolineales bacterium]
MRKLFILVLGALIGLTPILACGPIGASRVTPTPTKTPKRVMAIEQTPIPTLTPTPAVTDTPTPLPPTDTP